MYPGIFQILLRVFVPTLWSEVTTWYMFCLIFKYSEPKLVSLSWHECIHSSLRKFVFKFRRERIESIRNKSLFDEHYWFAFQTSKQQLDCLVKPSYLDIPYGSQRGIGKKKEKRRPLRASSLHSHLQNKNYKKKTFKRANFLRVKMESFWLEVFSRLNVFLFFF